MILRLFRRATQFMLSSELEFNPRLENHLTACVRRAQSNTEAPGQTLADLLIGAWK